MAESNAAPSANEEPVDEELDELLNSAINDFDKPSDAPAEAKTDGKADKGVGDLWGSEFTALEAEEELKLMEQKMKELFSSMGDGAFGGSEELDDDFKKIAAEANRYFTDSTSRDTDFTNKISQALKSLSVDAENVKTPLDPEALSSMFNGLQFGESGMPGDFLPMMHDIMQMFLSKEVFYPPLKDICVKFPKWLEREKGNLTENDYQNYVKQHKLMENVCHEFEQENANDSDEVRKNRFTKILSLMEEIQKFGVLPEEFTEASLLQNLDGLKLPPDMPRLEPGQCAVM
ncbi:peroxisomal biogenesis factor 19 [Cimex lectularius]|uniref:Peroxin-19 n=1 Tax=Cimex lectularius TaxID=79782 RepID=A0A8I6S1S8_CIMLE|nr:peroxisomal biogenesis factor 19 [Cimex lectularius]